MGRPFGDYTRALTSQVGNPRVPGGAVVNPQPNLDMNPQPRLRYMDDARLAQMRDLANEVRAVVWVYNFTGNFLIPAGAGISQTRRIHDENFFALTYIVIQYQETEVGVPDLFELQLSDTSKSIDYFDFPVNSALIAGTPTEPFWLPYEIIFSPNASIRVAVTDLSGVDNEPRILLGGREYHT